MVRFALPPVARWERASGNPGSGSSLPGRLEVDAATIRGADVRGEAGTYEDFLDCKIVLDANRSQHPAAAPIAPAGPLYTVQATKRTRCHTATALEGVGKAGLTCEANPARDRCDRGVFFNQTLTGRRQAAVTHDRHWL